MLKEYQELKELSRKIELANFGVMELVFEVMELVDVIFNEYNEVAKSRDAYSVETERLKNDLIDYEVEWKLLTGENASYKRMLTEKSQENEALVRSHLIISNMNFIERLSFVLGWHLKRGDL